MINIVGIGVPRIVAHQVGTFTVGVAPYIVRISILRHSSQSDSIVHSTAAQHEGTTLLPEFLHLGKCRHSALLIHVFSKCLVVAKAAVVVMEEDELALSHRNIATGNIAP